jgi:hypothetical protein
MPTALATHSHIPALVLAELAPDGFEPRPELDLDLDQQDTGLYEPESRLEVAIPGRW